MAYVKRTVEEEFVLFPTIKQCAAAAAPVFRENRWRWTRCGIPTQVDIELTLRQLQAEADEYGYLESGRLIYYKGQFGYERPKSKV